MGQLWEGAFALTGLRGSIISERLRRRGCLPGGSRRKMIYRPQDPALLVLWAKSDQGTASKQEG